MSPSWPNGLILTPVKDAVVHLPTYFGNLEALAKPLDRLGASWRRAQRWKTDFGYRISPGLPRWTFSLQLVRRTVLARSRNHLLFRALDDEEWVLWLDVDVVEYPPDIVQRLLAVGRNVVTPNCVIDYGGPSLDENAWRGPGHRLLSDLRHEGELVELDTVGGMMLLIRADLHRDGLIFPAFPYGRATRAPARTCRSSKPKASVTWPATWATAAGACRTWKFATAAARAQAACAACVASRRQRSRLTRYSSRSGSCASARSNQ